MSAREILPLLLLTVTAAGVACGGGGGSPGPTPTPSPTPSPSPAILSFRGITTAPSLFTPMSAGTFHAGENTTSGIFSLQYAIRSIEICRSVATTGAWGWTAAQGCLTVYQGPDQPGLDDLDPTHDLSGQGTIARATTAGYVDLMSPASRGQLASDRPLTAADLGSYGWALIDWYLPVKVDAQVPLDIGEVVHTFDGTVQSISNGRYLDYRTVATSSLGLAVHQPAVVMSPLSGAWTRFQEPFVIGSADLASSAHFDLDLFFDPDAFLKGAFPVFDPTPGNTDGVNQIFLPPVLDLAPVARRSGQAIRRERWRTDPTNTGFRLELYSFASDPTHTVQAATLRPLAEPMTIPLSALPPVSGVVVSAGGLSFQSVVGTLVSGFVDGTGATPAIVHCESFPSFNCSAPTAATFVREGVDSL